ncbi:MAG: sulfatase-like hydrolase/transferase [Phycisphaerae bacterium]|jgi:arylsulfatase A-like enzyme|nr:sulfatase-like hydrolase/transferase [Phycisphaerae bacterium]
MNRNTHQYRRRDLLRAAGTSAIALLVARSAPAAKRVMRPNILWITVEDMSPNLGCYGDKYATTPNIDRLAAESVRYTNVFATAPVCSPVRSCLVTGVIATSMGTSNLRSQFPIPEEFKGTASYLRDKGYYCTNNVKTDYNTSNASKLVKACWNQCSSKAHWRGKKAGQPFFAIFNDMVTHQSRSMVMPYAQFARNVQSKLSDSERHDPSKAPLPPYYPDTPITRRTVARYYDCISVMDKNTALILRQLEADGLADDTIVFFYSDHGAGLPRHKRLVLDSGLRVPLLIRFPKKYEHLAPAKAGETIDRMLSFVDFPPTLLSLVGITPPKYMQGQIFLGRSAAKPQTHIYAARDRVDEAYDLARCVRDSNWLYVRNYMPHLSYNQPSFYSDQGEIRNDITALAAAGKLKTTAQKHYAGPTRAREELYDTANDPHQINNLAGDPKQAQRIEKMRKLLRGWMADVKDMGFIPECDLAGRIKGTTAYQLARSDTPPPIERIIDAAELVGSGPKAINEQIKLLQDTDSAVRYWAAVGLRAIGPKAVLAAGPLAKAMGDSSPAVRVEAAWALVDLGGNKKALTLLATELEGSNQRAAVRAARALQMLGEKARPVLPAMQRALKASARRGDGPMFVRFALTPAVKALTKRS